MSVTNWNRLDRLIAGVSAHEQRAQRGFNLTPSENVLSPFARLPFVLDAYARYFLDDERLFGRWFFPAGQDLGSVEQGVLLPLLREQSGAAFVNVRALSGIHCMTIALAALAAPGDVILTVPVEVGGHASTTVVAQRLGLRVLPIPFRTPHAIDLDRLRAETASIRPVLLYIDQSTELFPIDPAPLRAIVDEVSPNTVIHYDSSHVNGLILGGALFNPLARGADSFGGSTHKTLPGPHKGFFATNSEHLASRYRDVTDHFVSHHHMADVISLAITLLELELCDGATYAHSLIGNAKAFAAALRRRAVDVEAADRGFTACHQVWAAPPDGTAIAPLVERLRAGGLLVNTFNGLPGVARPAFRFSLAEVTRLGAGTDAAIALAEILADAIADANLRAADIRARVEPLRARYPAPQYCFGEEVLDRCGLPDDLRAVCRSVFTLTRAPLAADEAAARAGCDRPR